MSVTYGRIRSMFYDLLGDSESSPVYIENSDALEFANKACRMAANRGKLIDRYSTILCEADVGEYNLPSDAESIYRVTYNGEKLMPLSQVRGRLLDSQWNDYSGTPTHYYLDELNGKVGLYPKPSSDTSITREYDAEYGLVVDDGGTFDSEYGIIIDTTVGAAFDGEYGVEVGGVGTDSCKVYFWARPAEIELTSDRLPLPLWGSYYALWTMLAEAYEVDTEIQDFERAQAYRLLAETMVPRMRMRAMNKTKKVYKIAGRVHERRVSQRHSRFPETIPDAGTYEV